MKGTKSQKYWSAGATQKSFALDLEKRKKILEQAKVELRRLFGRK